MSNLLESYENLTLRQKLATWVVILLFVLLAVTAGFFYWKYAASHPSATDNQATTKRIITKVGHHYLVPGGEQPTVARLQDKTKFANQDFLKAADNGDYIVVYPKARLALIYRESADRLVNVAPISIDSAPQATSTATP